MSARRGQVSRRAALAGLAGLGGLTAALDQGPLPQLHAQPPPPEGVPVKGKAGPGLEPFDAGILQIMDRHGVPGASFAVARHGKLVLAKGYGWANVTTGEPVQPDTLFGVASLTKPFTATAILKLVEQEKLSLDDRVFDILKHIKAPRGATVDRRLGDITVRHCLNHAGGWDRTVTGDPSSWEPQICRTLKLRPPLSAEQLISFTLSVPLQFDPGTDSKYSNFGFIVLGEVIARVSRQPYSRFVADQVLKPVGIKSASLHALNGKYLVGEALRHLAGTMIVLPPMQLPMIDASGGWSVSAIDLVRFMTNLDGSRGESILNEKTRKLMFEPPPRPLGPKPDGSHIGLGWDSVLLKDKALGFVKEGSYQGMRTSMKRMPTGVCWALLYNASMEFDPHDMQIAAATVHEVRQFVDAHEKYPDIDLFKEYP